MMKKIILMVACFQVITGLVKVYGQDDVDKLIPKTIMPSPNAAGLAKYGDYGVSFYTGLPEISIPIFTAKSGGLSVPITLSYHASGITYGQLAGWCGLGWSLSAGGQITRTTQGLPDEDYYVLNPSIGLSVCMTYGEIYGIVDGTKDSEPDIFSYSYPGKGGKFMLGPGGSAPYLFPFEPIVISPQLGYPRIPNINITGEDGTVYRFGADLLGNTATEDTDAVNGGFSKTARTSWYLMDMAAPNSHDEITFSYQPIGSTYTEDISQSITVNDELQVFGNIPSSPPVWTRNNDKISSSTILNALGVKTIKFDGGQVDFWLASGNRSDQNSQALDHIDISSIVNGVPVVIKRIRFVYSYFSGVQRLKLDQVLFQDLQNNTIEKYAFTYFTNSFSWNASTKSCRRDYWGFYNGATNTSLIPQTIIDFRPNLGANNSPMTIGDADRTTNTIYAKEGLLQRIDFPTGGSTVFDFESHKYLDNNSNTVYTGGVRVSKITSTAGPGFQPVVKTYKYGVNESGFGVPNFTFDKYFFSVENATKVKDEWTNSGGELEVYELDYRSRTYLSNSALDLSSNEGSPVVYQNVTEYFGDTGGNNGKVVYEFDNGVYLQDLFSTVNYSTRVYRNSIQWKRGNLTKKTTFDVAGNKLAETQITYQSFKDESRGVGNICNAYHYYLGGNILGNYCVDENNHPRYGDEYVVSHYSQNTGAMRQVSVVNYTYENGNVARYSRQQTDQSYDPDYLLTRSSTTNSSSGKEDAVTYVKYPFSYGTIASPATGNAKAIQSLQNKHVLTTPVETFHYLQNVDGSNQRVVSGQLTLFKENPANTNYIVPDEIDILEASTPIALGSFTSTAVNSGATGINKDSHYQSRIKFTTYDKYGNLVDLAKTNDKSTAYVWGYNNKFPIAEIVNSDVSRVNVYVPKTHVLNPTITSSMSASLPSTTFTLDNTQTVSISIQVYKNTTGAPTGTPYVDLNLSNQDWNAGFSVTRYYITASPTVITTTLPPGDYTFYYKGDNAGNTGINLSVSTSYQGAEPSCKVFHSSFEDDGTVNTEAHTGTKVWNGAYTFHLPSQNGSYTLSYWQKSATPGGSWSYTEQTVTVTSTNAGANTTIGSAGNIIDEVRLYPSTALMTTYTYNPLLGITTATDPSNITTYYTYDSYGRLMSIKDDKQKILKNYQYQYNAAPVYTNPE